VAVGVQGSVNNVLTTLSSDLSSMVYSFISTTAIFSFSIYQRRSINFISALAVSGSAAVFDRFDYSSFIRFSFTASFLAAVLNAAIYSVSDIILLGWTAFSLLSVRAVQFPLVMFVVLFGHCLVVLSSLV